MFFTFFALTFGNYVLRATYVPRATWILMCSVPLSSIIGASSSFCASSCIMRAVCRLPSRVRTGSRSGVPLHLQAVKLKPRFCDAYNNLASAYMQLGHTQEAIETYQV